MKEKWKEKVRASIKKNLEFLMEDPTTKRSWTCVTELEYTTKYKWAIVMAWMDYDENGEWKIYAYVGKMKKNSIMSEYGYDWEYPYCPNGEDVWDTEVSSPDDWDFNWLIEQFEEMEKCGLENLE